MVTAAMKRGDLCYMDGAYMFLSLYDNIDNNVDAIWSQLTRKKELVVFIGDDAINDAGVKFSKILHPAVGLCWIQNTFLVGLDDYD